MEARLIHLVKLAKAYRVQGAAPAIVLRPTTTILPADRRLAVLGQRQEDKSAFMRMLAGIEAPTSGQVVPDVRLSPLIKAGGLFHPRTSVPENVRYCARALDLDPEQLLSAVHAHIGATDGDSGLRERERRKALEVALLTMLAFNCYLIDEIGHLAEGVRHRHLDALSQ